MLHDRRKVIAGDDVPREGLSHFRKRPELAHLQRAERDRNARDGGFASKGKQRFQIFGIGHAYLATMVISGAPERPGR